MRAEVGGAECRALISVIVPVYNAEGYAEEAVCSAPDQPLDLELILVVDGSADHSLQVCRRLAQGSQAAWARF